ncbi:MAG: acyl-homoserine-lactone acylase [Crocinitomicaceae bacterium]|jgi:acyl-homoserine-lactone acylase
MSRIYLLLILVLASCSTEETAIVVLTETERWEKHAADTEIIRDDFGVPHIYGKTDADAVFGLMYAQCEDDFNRVEHNYIWALGRLAEVEGEEKIYSDLRAKLYMTEPEAIAAYEKAPEWLQKLCIAFADGINFYLSKNSDVKPKLLTRFEPWMPMFFSEGSIGGDIERVSEKDIKDFYDKGADSSITAMNDGMKDETSLQRELSPRGSNGFAISGSRTKSGNAMLLINPHTSFFFRGEVHMVSEEGLNAYGAVTWGQFFVYQGFNEKTGWMHTSTGTDIIDEFAEIVTKSKNGGLTYSYGKEEREVEINEVVLKYSTADGIKTRSFTTYRTHHGPITHETGDKWISTALMWDPVKALEQSFTRTKKSNHKEFYEMMEIRTNSSNNTVYADADGTIAYYHGNFIPKRDTKYDYTNPVDGSNPKTDWNGVHSLSDNIIVVNPKTGWLQNCNSTPFTCAGKYSPKREDYPVYMASFPENYRAIHAIPLLNATKDLTKDKLIELAYDPYLPGAEELVKGLLEALSQRVRVQIENLEACSILKNWDFKVDSTSKAMPIVQYYFNAFHQDSDTPDTNIMGKIKYMSHESSHSKRIQMFLIALAELRDHHGSSSIKWGDLNRYQRINGDRTQPFNDSLKSYPVGMAMGIFGALASYDIRHRRRTRKQYGISGNSFVAVVEFGDKVTAKSLLTGGQSGDPNSPHFDDQMHRYINGEFKTVAYYREDVVKRAKSTYHPGDKR